MSMTNEQREAINRLESLVELRRSKTGTIKYDNCICGTTDLDTVLLLIQEQDKQIDLMARAFKQNDVRTVEEIKQYFAGLVEKE